MRFTQKKLFINFAKKNASRNWAGKEPDQSHYFVYLPPLFDRVRRQLQEIQLKALSCFETE